MHSIRSALADVQRNLLVVNDTLAERSKLSQRQRDVMLQSLWTASWTLADLEDALTYATAHRTFRNRTMKATAQALLDALTPVVQMAVLNDLKNADELPVELQSLLPVTPHEERALQAIVETWLQERREHAQPNALLR